MYTYTFLEASEAGINFSNFLLSHIYKFLYDLFLHPNNRSELCVYYSRVQFAVHEGRSLVVLYVSLVHSSRQLNVFTETLLLEVAYCKFISEGKEVQYVVSDVVILEVVHEVSAVSFHLFVGRDRTEHYLAEALRMECPEADATNRPAFFDQSQCLVFRIEH